MFIITEYELIDNGKKIFYVKSNGLVPPCTFCRADLPYRDSRRRVSKLEGEVKRWLAWFRQNPERIERLLQEDLDEAKKLMLRRQITEQNNKRPLEEFLFLLNYRFVSMQVRDSS